MGRILIVDDEPAILEIFRRLLAFPDVEIDVASSRDEAIGCLSASSYDLVILDLRIGASDDQEGLNLIAEVKRRTPETRVILITGYGTPGVMREAERLGADRYFEKPLSHTVLRRVIQEMGVAK